jgi:hypothetical protein
MTLLKAGTTHVATTTAQYFSGSLQFIAWRSYTSPSEKRTPSGYNYTNCEVFKLVTRDRGKFTHCREILT